MSPEVREALLTPDQLKLIEYLNGWINKKINDDLKNLIDGSRIIDHALLYKNKIPLKEELKTIKFAFASVVTIRSCFMSCVTWLRSNNIR